MWWIIAFIAVLFMVSMRTKRGVDAVMWLDHTGLPVLFAVIIVAVPFGGAVWAVMVFGAH